LAVVVSININPREQLQDFPWFKDATIGKVLNVEEVHADHFYWPDLDVDLTAEIIEHPERFPLRVK
jgi:hypothetical protein